MLKLAQFRALTVVLLGQKVARQAKVGDQAVHGRIDEHVARRRVAVDDVVLGEVRHPAADLERHPQLVGEHHGGALDV